MLLTTYRGSMVSAQKNKEHCWQHRTDWNPKSSPAHIKILREHQREKWKENGSLELHCEKDIMSNMSGKQLALLSTYLSNILFWGGGSAWFVWQPAVYLNKSFPKLDKWLEPLISTRENTNKEWKKCQCRRVRSVSEHTLLAPSRRIGVTWQADKPPVWTRELTK